MCGTLNISGGYYSVAGLYTYRKICHLTLYLCDIKFSWDLSLQKKIRIQNSKELSPN